MPLTHIEAMYSTVPMVASQKYEGVGQGAVLVDRAPHQALGDAVDPHRGDVSSADAVRRLREA